MQSESKKLDSLVLLRGLAVLSVCICHFASLLYQDISAVWTAMGRIGVHIFFVVSGFVIPLSLYRGKYVLRNYGRFLGKRFLRLQLPYVASVCLTYLIILLSVIMRHIHTDETIFSFIQSLFYLHIPVMNGVYWTLTVEIQYYVFIGLLFPLLLKHPVMATALFIVISIVSFFLFGSASEHYLNFLLQSPFFFTGIAGFMVYAGIGNKTINILVIACLLIFILYASPVADFISSLFAVLFILAYTQPVYKALLFPGNISYSVYLIHFPIGYNLAGFLMMRTGEGARPWIVVFVMLIVFAIGYLFYRLFEVPSEAWSAKMKYIQGKYHLPAAVKEQSEDAVDKATVQ